MAYVIAVCGSGGKTTLCRSLAKKYADENKKVCLMTTTHMWYDLDKNYSTETNIDDIKEVKNGIIYFLGKIDDAKEKITYMGDESYKKICDTFDVVIIEADGSRSMPMKILDEKRNEPVIPENASEIIIVVGLESIGREIGYVCHRFDELLDTDKYIKENNISKTTIVTKDLLYNFVNHYYKDPLKERFENARITVYDNDFRYKSLSREHADSPNKKILCAILASGFSKRYEGENKLYIDIPESIVKLDEGLNVKDVKLYQLMIEKLLSARDIVYKRAYEDFHDIGLKKEDLQIDIAVVTQYREILDDKFYSKRVMMIENDNPETGVSSSIKLAIEKAKNYDAVVFINADMPLLKSKELSNFIYESILNNAKLSSMYAGFPRNPAYFEKEFYNEAYLISGDKGLKEILEKNIRYMYRYYINPKYLFEIDEKKDYEELCKSFS